MPSGGVSLGNMHEWFASGAYVVGVGGGLVGPAKNDDYKAVLHNAQAFHNEFQSIIYANSAVTRKVPVKA